MAWPVGRPPRPSAEFTPHVKLLLRGGGGACTTRLGLGSGGGGLGLGGGGGLGLGGGGGGGLGLGGGGGLRLGLEASGGGLATGGVAGGGLGGAPNDPQPSKTPVMPASEPPVVIVIPYAMVPAVVVLVDGSAARSAAGYAVRLLLPGSA